MIPRVVGDLDALGREVERQRAAIDEIFSSVPNGALTWRPDPTRWSIAGHLAHLGIVNEGYLGAIERTIADARRKGGPLGVGPYRHPWVTTRFVAMLEPPPKRRVATFRSMVPDPALGGDEARRTFEALQLRLADLIDAARGLDLGRVRFSSPFFRPLRFSLGTGFELLLTHNRRHLWLVREIMGREDFPPNEGNRAREPRPGEGGS
ncbi:MAG: DinB family protein [Gemmatimonadota bacterium]|nr:DinB family protein [Gemmatimonadota bacterium]